MSGELLIRNCSPTLAGLKTGNMFSFPCPSDSMMREAVRDWNKKLTRKGIRMLPLRYNGKNALIYIYRPAKLKNDLTDKTARDILHGCGYCPGSPELCIVQLIKRFAAGDEFPHEVGLFLGYPPEDVCGFIENRAGCKCAGLWKVYGDVEAAERTFEKYKKCTRVYCEQYAKGSSVERLTVAG